MANSIPYQDLFLRELAYGLTGLTALHFLPNLPWKCGILISSVNAGLITFGESYLPEQVIQKTALIAASLICLNYAGGVLLGRVSVGMILANGFGELAHHIMNFAITPVESEKKSSHKWQFESDHLPVGVSLDGIEMISWNVLNQAFIGHIQKGTQGLNGSMITTLSKEERESKAIEHIKEMLSEGKELVSLQECSEDFLKGLKRATATHIDIIVTGGASCKNRNVILYSKNRFHSHSSFTDHAFSKSSTHSILDVSLTEKTTGKVYRILNVHVAKASLDEFKEYLQKLGPEPAVVMGDMNFDPKDMNRVFSETKCQLVDPLYPSHFNTKKQAVSYDQFWTTENATALPPEKVASGVKEMVDVLKT